MIYQIVQAILKLAGVKECGFESGPDAETRQQHRFLCSGVTYQCSHYKPSLIIHSFQIY